MKREESVVDIGRKALELTVKRIKTTAVVGALAAAVVVGLGVVVAAPRASASTCGSNWCSGSDSNTGSNIQGNTPQVYFGEVDTYQNDFYGSSGVAWSNTGANGAVSRYNSGGGIGVEDYYFGGGAGVNNQGVSNTCFGAKQGYNETYHMYVTYRTWWPYQYMSFIDIEDPVSDYGWYSSEQSANRDVYNGWYDYVVGDNPCGYGANANDITQPGVYSAPDAWNSAIDTGIPKTYTWTYETCCEDSWPGSNWGGNFQNFGSSGYRFALQYDQGPDYDDAYEPDYLPATGITLGN